jgi:pseudaminic acid cytidylyltransferase
MRRAAVRHLRRSLVTTAENSPGTSQSLTFRRYRRTSTRGSVRAFLRNGYRRAGSSVTSSSLHVNPPRSDSVQNEREARRRSPLCVAVIPARSGSKRIPGKNIRNFLGKPAISYPIAAARDSRLFNRIVVSTDCPKIAAVATSLGADVPFLRPAELAGDYCGTFPVFRHALNTLESETSNEIAFACLIYPTAVLLTERHLIEAFNRLARAPEHAYCFSVCQYYHPIQRALQVDHLGQVVPVSPEHLDSRTQDLEPHYFDVGQFYWARRAAVTAGTPIFSSASLPYTLRWGEFVDIDDPDDWARAEAIAGALRAARARGHVATADEPAAESFREAGRS